MASKSQIASQASLDLGGKAISDVENETFREATLVKEIWDTTRDEVLVAYEWGFATKMVALALDASFTNVDDKWTYVYTLPTDYLKLLRGRNNFDYEIREGRFYTDKEDAVIGYLFRATDESKYPTWFNTALAARLRARMAIPLNKVGSRTADWYGLYVVELKTAMTMDAQDNKLTDTDYGKHLDANDTWLQSAKI